MISSGATAIAFGRDAILWPLRNDEEGVNGLEMLLGHMTVLNGVLHKESMFALCVNTWTKMKSSLLGNVYNVQEAYRH